MAQEQAFFTFGTNALAVSEQVRRALLAVTRQVRQTQAQLAGGGINLMQGGAVSGTAGGAAGGAAPKARQRQWQWAEAMQRHAMAHRRAASQVDTGRAQAQAESQRLRSATARHAQERQRSAAQEAQLRRAEAARRMRGLPAQQAAGGGMGGPAQAGEIFTQEGMTGHAQRYARYAAVSAAIFTLQAAMRDTWEEAQHLEEATTDLEVALGRGRDVSREFSDDLMEVARIAGTNVGQAMESAARGVRAFSDSMDDLQAREDAGTATAEAAERLSVIADKDVESATGDIIAIGTSYGLVAGQLDRVNEAIANAKRLGGFPAEVAQGSSSAAQAFEQAGFQLEELTSSIGVVQARLDQSGRTTASRLARVFQESRGGEAQALLQQLGVDTGGQMRDQIDQLAQLVNSGDLAERQINAIVEAMAGTRASREFLALLQNWNEIQQNVTRTVLQGGKATDEFNRRLNNLAGLLRRIRGSLTGIQTGLIESGFFAPVGGFLRVLEPTLRGINEMLQLINRLPGPLTTVVSLFTQWKLATAALARFGGARMISRGVETAMPGERLLGPAGAQRLRQRAAASAMRREPSVAREAGITREAAARPRITREDEARRRLTGTMRQEQATRQQLNATTAQSTAALRRNVAAATQAATAENNLMLAGQRLNTQEIAQTQAMQRQYVTWRQLTGATQAQVVAAQQAAATHARLSSAMGQVAMTSHGAVQASRAQAAALTQSRVAVTANAAGAQRAAAAYAGLARAQQANVAASRTVQTSAISTTTAINAETASLRANIAAWIRRQQSARATGGAAVGAAQRSLGRARGAARAAAGSPLARVGGGMVAISALMSVWDSFQDVSQASESAAQALEDLRNAADADAFEEAARQLSTASNEMRDAATGVSGFWQGLFRQREGGLPSGGSERSTEGWLGGIGELLGQSIPGLAGLQEALEVIPGIDFGDAPAQAAEDLERAAFEAARLSDRLSDAREEAARAGEAGVFGAAVKSVDDLEAGMEALDKQAKTAGEKLDVLFEALQKYDEFGDQTGVVAAGGAEALGASLSDQVFGIMQDALAQGERANFSDIDFGEFDVTTEQVKQYFRMMEDDARDIGDLTEQWAEALQEAGHSEEEAGDIARERARNVQDAAAEERRRRQEAMRDVEDLMPDEAESVDISRMIVDTAVNAISAAGLEEGGQLDPEQVRSLASRVVDDAIAGSSGEGAEELEAKRNELIDEVEDALEGLTNFSEMPQEIRNELANIVPQLAQEKGGNVETMQRDAVAGVRKRLEVLKNTADLFGDDIPRWLKVAMEEARQDLEDAVDKRMQDQLELAQALLPEGDLAGRTQLQIDELQRRLDQAEDAGDTDEARRLRTELAKKRRNQAEERRDRAAAQDELAAGHDEVAQAAAELDAAQRELDATERLDSAGEVSQAWAEQKLKAQEAKLAYDRAEANRARAIAGAQIDPRNELAQTRADLDEAIALLEAEAAATEEGERSDEYWQKKREVAELRLQEARGVAEREQARRRAGIDPRNAMAEAVEDVKSAQEDVALELEGTSAYWEAIRELREAQQSQAELEAEMASAQRRANIDPRATVDNAKADLADARDELALAHPGDPEYYELQREVAEAELDVAEARRERASAARQANVFPGASLAKAEADLADAKAELDAAKPNEQGYYEALAEYRQAQWDLSEAAAERSAERRKLGLDITDDVVMAREELAQARERLQRLRAAGAPQELLDEQRNAVRDSEAQAEQAAFQQRMRDARVAEELGRMSHQAYISFLNSEAERLRSIADRTRQQQEMLDEVDQALQQAGSQMEDQFNLGDIDIPTPFEVRRAMEAKTQGLGFGQMNRTEVVNSETNVQINGADLVEVKSMLKELLGPAAMSRTSVGSGRRV